MNRKYFSVRHITGRLLSGALALLGFTACNVLGGETPDMYGTPLTSFEVKGKVTDTDAAPVPDADIILRYLYPKGTVTLPGDTVRTDKKGQYKIEGSAYAAPDVRIVCKPANSSLEADSVQLSQINSTDRYNLHIDFTLKKKENRD